MIILQMLKPLLKNLSSLFSPKVIFDYTFDGGLSVVKKITDCNMIPFAILKVKFPKANVFQKL